MKKRKLTEKQKRFVSEYLETGNATEAAARAYDCKNRTSAGAIGSDSLESESVQQAIVLYQKRRRLTADDVLERLEHWTEDPHPLVALKAIELLGKYHKLFTDKADLSGDMISKIKMIGWDDAPETSEAPRQNSSQNGKK